MTLWLLVYFQVHAGQPTGVALLASFVEERVCIEARGTLVAMGLNVLHSRCIEASLGEQT